MRNKQTDPITGSITDPITNEIHMSTLDRYRALQEEQGRARAKKVEVAAVKAEILAQHMAKVIKPSNKVKEARQRMISNLNKKS